MLVDITPRLRRITAPNPGMTTGEGTNTYICGHEKVAVIDPGPAIPSHIDAVLDAVGDRLEWIIVTHTHNDHSPAAQALAKRTGAPRIGSVASHADFQDASFQADQKLSHNQLITTSEFTLRAIHTPGHVDNHFCFLLEEDCMLIAGDHLMNGSTVVIIPPQGDMKAYIESLQSLLHYPLKSIAPGHGEIIDKPRELIEWTVAHRLQREQKVLDRLREFPQGVVVSQLVSTVYDDVDKSLHGIAEYSLLAHLLKLEAEAKARKVEIGETTQWSGLLD